MPVTMITFAEAVTEACGLAGAFIGALFGQELGPAHRLPRLADGMDACVLLIFAAVIFAINWVFRKMLVEPLAWVVLPRTNIKTVQKFAQAASEVTMYGSFAVFGLVIVPRQEWAWPPDLWFKGFVPYYSPNYPGEHSLMTSPLCCFYILYAARYLQAMITVELEHKRKDYVEMQIHHIATVSLVCLSYGAGWNRIGVVIMLLLDPADVPLQAAKVLKYLSDARCRKNPNNAWKQTADRLFEVFAATFLVTRLVCYPYVVYCAHTLSFVHLTLETPEYTCLLLLDILLVLQVFWFYLVLQAAWKYLVLGQEAEDNRSDEEEDAPREVSIANKKKE